MLPPMLRKQSHSEIIFLFIALSRLHKGGIEKLIINIPDSRPRAPNYLHNAIMLHAVFTNIIFEIRI